MKKQQGFAVLGALLIIVIIAAIVGTGWYVWNSKQETDSALNSTSSVLDNAKAVKENTYTDTAGSFTFKYPSNWKVVAQTEPAGEGPAPDFTKESAAVNLYAPNKRADSSSDMIAFNSDATYEIVLENAKKDSMHTVTKTTVNGHRALVDLVKFVGPSSAEKYTDHLFYIENGTDMLMAAYRESYYHNYPKANWSDTTDLAAFKKIVESIQFTE
jgi:hypothetical protein